MIKAPVYINRTDDTMRIRTDQLNRNRKESVQCHGWETEIGVEEFLHVYV